MECQKGMGAAFMKKDNGAGGEVRKNAAKDFFGRGNDRIEPTRRPADAREIFPFENRMDKRVFHSHRGAKTSGHCPGERFQRMGSRLDFRLDISLGEKPEERTPVVLGMVGNFMPSRLDCLHMFRKFFCIFSNQKESGGGLVLIEQLEDFRSLWRGAVIDCEPDLIGFSRLKTGLYRA